MAVQALNKNPQTMNRKKILEAIVFFTQKKKLKNPSKTMIYKLLAEIDFRHFAETGLPITNLKYEAFKKGPVPRSFHNEITKGKELVFPEDFQDSFDVQSFDFINEKGEKSKGFNIVARRSPDLKIFSPRQIRIMEEVAEIYKTATAKDASKGSHEPGKPWSIAVQKRGEGSIIDLLDDVQLYKSVTKELASEKLKEKEAMIYNYGE